MTVSSNIIKAGPYTCNGVRVDFDFAFKTFDEVQVRVVYADTDGVEADLALDSDFTLALNANQNSEPGGTVTVSPARADGTITIISASDFLQETDLTNGGGFYPQTVEDMIDKLAVEVQELDEAVARSVKTQVSSTEDPNDLVDSLFEAEVNAAASASAAASSAAAAAASADAAAASADAAAASETAAATSETNAAASETAAATSETNAAASETAAAASAAAADASAAAAATSETNAAASEAAASTSETNAAASEAAASTSETNAAASEAAAAASATAAETAAASVSRVGEYIEWAGDDTPSYALFCNGAAVSRTTYANLFAKIGTLHGAGDGSTTFNLPNIPADYTTVQASGNEGSSTVGEVITHAHDQYYRIGGSSGVSVGGTGNAANGTLTLSNVDTGITGGSANLAAGLRVRKCIIF